MVTLPHLNQHHIAAAGCCAGRATGEAYVVLAPAANPQAVLSHLDKKYIGNRYIE